MGLLRLLRDHGDAVESDLSQYHHIDIRDRWRVDEHGRRALTLRMIAVRLRFLPPDAATVIATGGTGWTLNDILLADVFHATAGNPHPGRPDAEKPDDAAQAKRAAAFHQRAAERQRQIDVGEIT